MDKEQPPYKPYFTNRGNYAVNIAVVGANNFDKKLSEKISIKNIFDNISNPVQKPITRGDLLKIAGVSTLCSYYGKDFYDLWVTGCTTKEIVAPLEAAGLTFDMENNPPIFPYNYSSVYWHVFNSQINSQEYTILYNRATNPEEKTLIDQAPSGVTDQQPVQIKYLGIDTTLTKAYKTSSSNKKQSVHLYQILYKAPYFNSLSDMVYDKQAIDLLNREVEGTNNSELVFENYEDFEDKIDSLVVLLKHYQQIQKETFLLIEENKSPVDFDSLAELLTSFKLDFRQQLRINNKHEDERFSFTPEINLGYSIINPVMKTTRAEQLLKKIKNEDVVSPATLELAMSAEKEYAKNLIFKGFEFAKEPAGLKNLPQTVPAGMKEFNKDAAAAIYHNIISEKVKYGGSGVSEFLKNLFSINNQDLVVFFTGDSTGSDKLFGEILEAMPLRNVDPKVVLLLSNLQQLAKLSKKSINQEEGCVNSYVALSKSIQNASKLLSSTEAMSAEDLKAGQEVELDDGLKSNPPDLIQFSKRYIEYPKNVDGGRILPFGVNQDTYTPVTSKLQEGLSDNQKAELINKARNQQPKPRFKEAIKEVLTPQGIELKRRATSIEVSGVNFFNEAGDFELDFDAKNLMARRNRSFADQIGDEIFKVTPRTPAKIRNIDDAYKFFLSKLDLSTIAREALKCTFLKYSIDDVIEYMCDALLDNFFAAFGTNTEEVIDFIDNVKTKQYKFGDVDLTFSVQAALKDIETQFSKWAVEQNTTLHQNIAGEEVENAQDLSKPPPIGSESFYSTISDGFDGSTKRALCELLISGGVALTNALIKIYSEASTPSLEERTRPKAELELKKCKEDLSFNIPDNLPSFSRILSDITAQIERILRDYAEQFIITPLREALLNILSCGEEEEGINADELDLSGLFGGLDTEPSVNALLKAYISDVFSSLNTAAICSLLEGVPNSKTIGVCLFVAKAEKYKVEELQKLIRTQNQIISLFKKLGTPENLKACERVRQVLETADLCNDYSKVNEDLTRILKSLGLTNEEIQEQLKTAKGVNRGNVKGIINSIFGNPNNLISPSQVSEIVSKSAGFKKVGNKALDLVMDPIQDSMEASDFDSFKEGYIRAAIRQELDSLQGDIDVDSTPKGEFAKKATKDPYEATNDSTLIGLYDPENPEENTGSDLIISNTNAKLNIGDFEYSESNLFGDNARAARIVKELSDIESLFSVGYASIPAEISAFLGEQSKLKDILERANENIQRIIAKDLPEDSENSTVPGLLATPYSDFILNLEELKSVIATLSAQNYSDLAESEEIPPTHLYDAVYEGMVVLYTRIFLIQLTMNSLYLYDVFSPEYIMDTKMTRDYIREIMYPSLGFEFSKIKSQLGKISKTYLKDKSDVNVNYKASLNRLNDFAAELFGKVEKMICGEEDQKKLALPTSFENSNKLFKHLDIGDAMIYNGLLNENELFFENYATFDKIRTDRLSAKQIEDLTFMGVLNIDQTIKQAVSEKELFQIYKILFDGTDVNSFKRTNLLPIGFYVKNAEDAEFTTIVEGRDNQATLDYSPNYQSYKMMHGFVAQKYFKTAIRQFANGPVQEKNYDDESSWPQEWWDSGSGTQALQEAQSIYDNQLEATQILTETFISNIPDPLVNQFGTGLSSKGFNREQVIENIKNYKIPLSDYALPSDFGVDMAAFAITWEGVIETLNSKKATLDALSAEEEIDPSIRNVFQDIQAEFLPGVKTDPDLEYVLVSTLKDEDHVFETSGPYRKKFEEYYLHEEAAGDGVVTDASYASPANDGWDSGIQPKDDKIKDMFFPNYYRDSGGLVAVFNDEDYSQDADLILEGSINANEEAMTANPVYVEDYTNNFFYFAADTNSNITNSDYRESLLPDKPNRAGVCGRMVGKFYFGEPHPAAVNYFDEEQFETQPLEQGVERKFNLLTRDKFIEKFNSYRETVNPLYEDLISTLNNSGKGYINKPDSNIGLPNSIVKLQPLAGTDYIEAIDSEGNKKNLYFKEITIRVPVRLTSETGAPDGDWFSSDEYTKTKQGKTYEDDGNTLGFIYTKTISVVRVYYVESQNENFLDSSSEPEYYSTKKPLISENGQITEQTRICQIFDNFKYGCRLSLNIQPGENDAENELVSYLEQMINLGTVNSFLYYAQKQYLNMATGLVPFSQLFNNAGSDIYPDNPQLIGSEGTIVTAAFGTPKKTDSVVVLPLVKSEISFDDIRDNESGNYIMKSDKIKDIFKNFPSHTSQALTSAAHEFVSIEKLYGTIIGNDLFCDINKNKKLREFFRCGMKIQNFISFITLQTDAKRERIYNLYGIEPQFKSTKDTIQKVTDIIIRDREGDDI